MRPSNTSTSKRSEKLQVALTNEALLRNDRLYIWAAPSSCADFGHEHVVPEMIGFGRCRTLDKTQRNIQHVQRYKGVHFRTSSHRLQTALPDPAKACTRNLSSLPLAWPALTVLASSFYSDISTNSMSVNRCAVADHKDNHPRRRRRH